jgi:hypothetical protein
MSTQPVVLEGPVFTWDLNRDAPRRFVKLTLPYEQARLAIKTKLYNGYSGDGEQRPANERHVNKLRRAMEDGSFTPGTDVCAHVRPKARKAVEFYERDGREYARLAVQDEPVANIDGHQRMAGLEQLYQSGREDVLRQPISVTLYLDGDAQSDFVNLQLGKAVDTAHLMAMRTQKRMVAGKNADAVALGFEVARELHRREAGFFRKQIRFDGNGTADLKVNAICAAGSSDCSFSLAGLARLGQLTDRDAKALAEAVESVCSLLNARASELTQRGMLLTPPPDGTKGSATLLIGVTTLYLFRGYAQGRSPNDPDKDRLIKAARLTLADEANGRFTAPHRRQLLGRFAREYLADLPGPKHGDLPVSLLEVFVPSAYGAPALPKGGVKPAREKAGAAAV